MLDNLMSDEQVLRWILGIDGKLFVWGGYLDHDWMLIELQRKGRSMFGSISVPAPYHVCIQGIEKDLREDLFIRQAKRVVASLHHTRMRISRLTHSFRWLPNISYRIHGDMSK